MNARHFQYVRYEETIFSDSICNRCSVHCATRKIEIFQNHECCIRSRFHFIINGFSSWTMQCIHFVSTGALATWKKYIIPECLEAKWIFCICTKCAWSIFLWASFIVVVVVVVVGALFRYGRRSSWPYYEYATVATNIPNSRMDTQRSKKNTTPTACANR